MNSHLTATSNPPPHRPPPVAYCTRHLDSFPRPQKKPSFPKATPTSSDIPSAQDNGRRSPCLNGATVLLADDHAIFREGVSRLLKAAGFTVVGEAATGSEAVEKARDLQPTVVVLDIAMPQLYGIEACRRILAFRPDTKVVLLSGYSDDQFIEGAVMAGAAGYVMKQSSAECLVRAIHEVVKGNTFFSRSISRRMAYPDGRSVEGKARGPASATLTPRELEVLQLIAEGGSNKGIAATMGISMKTVEKHRQHLMDKLEIHETAGLTRYALATGVIESRVTITVS